MEESVKQAAQYSPLVLAYLGDAVYELYIRERILARGNQPVNRMHRQSSRAIWSPGSPGKRAVSFAGDGMRTRIQWQKMRA